MSECDGRQFVGAMAVVGVSSDGTVMFWEVRPKAGTEAVVGRYQAENVQSFFGPTGREYINVDAQGEVSIRNVSGGGLLRRYRVDVGALALSPDHRTLATVKHVEPLGDGPSGKSPSGALRAVTLYESMTGKVLRRVETPIEGWHLSFSHDGTRLVLDGDASPATDTQTISVLDVSTLRQVAVYEREPRSSITEQFDSGDTPNVLGMDARDRLIVGTDSGRVDIVEHILTRPTTHSLSAHAWELTALTMHRLSDIFATASGDGSIRLWDSTHDAPIGPPLRGGTEGTTALSFSPDGRTLAEGRQTGSIQLWDLDTRSPIGDPLTGHTDAVWSIEFSPDGKTLLSGGSEGTIRLWNTAHVLDPVHSLCKDLDHAFLVAQWRILAPTAPSTTSVCGT